MNLLLDLEEWDKQPMEVHAEDVARRSLAMDVAALRDLVKDGGLEIDRLDRLAAKAPSNVDPLAHRFHLWCDRLSALCRFSQNATTTHMAPTLPDLVARGITYPVATFAATEDFRAWFGDATAQLVNAWPRAMASTPASAGKAKGFVALTHWMACAVMMDMPEVVHAVHAVCPRAISVKMPLKDFTGNPNSQTMHVTPVWIAWNFSSHRCLDAMAAVSSLVQPDADIGYRFEKRILGKPEQHLVTLASEIDRSSFLPTSGLEGNDSKLRPDMPTLVRAISLCSQPIVTPDAMGPLAAQCLNGDWNRRSSLHLVEAFLASGVYAQALDPTLRTACLRGFPGVASAMVRALTEPVSADNLCWSIDNNDPQNHLIASSVRDVLLAVQEHQGTHEAQRLLWCPNSNAQDRACLLERIVESDLADVLVACLRAGLIEPHTASSHSDRTPMQMAKTINSPLVGVMASWLARNRTHALLEEMDTAVPRP